MKSIYDAIKEAQEELAKKLTGDAIFNIPAHIQPEDEACRQLDGELSKSLTPIIQQLNDGLISAVEFVDAVFMAASKQVP